MLCLTATTALADSLPKGAATTAATLLPVVIRESSAAPPSGGLAEVPPAEDLERRGATIGDISITIENIFDESDPRENKFLYRLANDLHLRTRESTVRDQLLFQPGDEFSAQQAEETARILRERRYLNDATVAASTYDPATNTVDLDVRVRDVWSFTPGVSFGRKGGENKSKLRIEDENFLGLGERIALGYTSDVDRSGVALTFEDLNLFHSWWGLQTSYADASDGQSVVLGVGRPFYSLDSRWSLGASVRTREQVTPLYDLGKKVDEFEDQNDLLEIQGGVSQGLVDGWARRWLAGYRYDRSRFAPAPADGDDDVPTVALPEDRTLSYPWVGIELIENRFETTHNQDQIGRTEDVFLGKELRAELGWATSLLGSDRSAGIFAVGGQLGRPVGEHDLVFLGGTWRGRLESGSTADALLEANTRYYHRFDDRNLFMTSLAAAHGSDLDLDHQLQLGGDNGLRGYPLRYQNGDTRALLTVEERYFTNWFPFRMFRVGGAVFADAGRTWGTAPLATEPEGWLADAGVGLRLGNARSGLGNVLHVDLAFPLTGGEAVDSVQFVVEARHSF